MCSELFYVISIFASNKNETEVSKRKKMLMTYLH